MSDNSHRSSGIALLAVLVALPFGIVEPNASCPHVLAALISRKNGRRVGLSLGKVEGESRLPRMATGLPLITMELAAARKEIRLALLRAHAAYGIEVFDEWALVSAGTKKGLLAYAGPRAEEFARQFPGDAVPLRVAVEGMELYEGDIEFTNQAKGTKHDALMKVGPTSFLVLNNTTKTLDEIRADPRWLGVQRILFELSEKFRSSPLKI